MKRILIIIFSVTVFLGLNSCESIGEAQATADEFFAALKSNNIEQAMTFFDKSMFDEFGEDKIKGLLEQHNTNFAGILSYSKYGFHTNTANGVTKVMLKFKVETENGIVFERLEFIKRGEEYKLNGYFFNTDQSKIDAE